MVCVAWLTERQVEEFEAKPVQQEQGYGDVLFEISPHCGARILCGGFGIGYRRPPNHMRAAARGFRTTNITAVNFEIHKYYAQKIGKDRL